MNKKEARKVDPFDYSSMGDDVTYKWFVSLVMEVINSSKDGWYIDFNNFYFTIIALPADKGGNRIIMDYFENERGYSVCSREGLSRDGFISELKIEMAKALAHPLFPSPKKKDAVYEQLTLF